MRDSRECCKIQNGEVINHHALVVGARSGIVRRFKSVAVVFIKVQMRGFARLSEKRVVEFLHLVVDGTLDVRKDMLSDCYDRTKERLDKVSGRIMERQAKREMIEAFLRDLAEMDEDVQEFTDDLWFNLLDHVTVFSKKDVMFTFKNGTEIRVK